MTSCFIQLGGRAPPLSSRLPSTMAAESALAIQMKPAHMKTLRYKVVPDRHTFVPIDPSESATSATQSRSTISSRKLKVAAFFNGDPWTQVKALDLNTNRPLSDFMIKADGRKLGKKTDGVRTGCGELSSNELSEGKRQALRASQGRGGKTDGVCTGCGEWSSNELSEGRFRTLRASQESGGLCAACRVRR